MNIDDPGETLMTMLATAARFESRPIPCPGPIPASAAHAARCGACGKCRMLARLDPSARDDRKALAASRSRGIE